MAEVNLEAGVCLGFGGTNARQALCTEGDISGFTATETPTQPAEFFAWMAHRALSAADQGCQWLVAGFPGPVSVDGTIIGPMANVAGLKDTTYNLHVEMAAADPAAGRLLKEGFLVIGVNDGDLAAQAVASRMNRKGHNRVAALIIGSGLGAGLAVRDRRYQAVFRAERDNSLEIGHGLRSANPLDTWENFASGNALARRYGSDPRTLPIAHPAWRDVGQTAAIMTLNLGLVNRAELVVPTGGVGAGASNMYRQDLENVFREIRRFGNQTQRHLLPEIDFMPRTECDVFEMFGAEGVMHDFMTRAPEATAA